MTKETKFWRLCPFKKGDVLKVSKDISAKRAEFNKSEILVFHNATSSLYNGMTEYTFKSESGEYKIFDMPDSDGIEKLTRLFTPTEEKPKSPNTFSLLSVLILVALIGIVMKVYFHSVYVIESMKNQPLYTIGTAITILGVFVLFKILKR